jgi:hypothetical protein
LERKIADSSYGKLPTTGKTQRSIGTILPRIFESIGPPMMVEDIYPEHLFETLTSLNFCGWPDDEKKTAIDYLSVVESFVDLNDVDRLEWNVRLARLSSI